MHATTIQACHRLGKVLNCELIKLTQNNVWKLAQLKKVMEQDGQEQDDYCHQLNEEETYLNIQMFNM